MSEPLFTHAEWILVLLGHTAFIIGALYIRQELRRTHRPLYYDPKWKLQRRLYRKVKK